MATTDYYVTTDAMGSVMAVLDEAGNVLERRSYDAFGQVTYMLPDGTVVADSPTGVDIGFQGQQIDELTGMYQMGYRWYSPVLGNCVSANPNQEAIARRFRYSGENPDAPAASAEMQRFFEAAEEDECCSATYYLMAHLDRICNEPKNSELIQLRTSDGSIDLSGWLKYIYEGIKRTPKYIYENWWTSTKRNLSDPEFVMISFAGGIGFAGSLSRLSSEADVLVHMTTKAEAIAESGRIGLPSNIYAGPIRNASLSGWRLTRATGLSPGKNYSAVLIPAESLPNFSKVIPVGPITSWQWLTGQQYTAFGFIELETGTFVRMGTNWNQMVFYGIDATTTTVSVFTLSQPNSKNSGRADSAR